MKMFRCWICGILGLLLLLLGGCYLASGERVQDETLQEAVSGELSGSFVQADGITYREVVTEVPATQPVRLDVDVLVEWGELTLQFFDVDGTSVLTVQSQYGSPGQGTVVVFTGASGQVPFRLQANEAQNGTYTIRYVSVRAITPEPEAEP